MAKCLFIDPVAQLYSWVLICLLGFFIYSPPPTPPSLSFPHDLSLSFDLWVSLFGFYSHRGSVLLPSVSFRFSAGLGGSVAQT